MAIFALTNSKVLVGPADLSNWSTEADIEMDTTSLDATTLGSGGAHAYIGGLRDGKMTLNGFYEAAGTNLPDDVIRTSVDVGGRVVSVYPQGATLGNAALFGSFLYTSYTPAGKVGDIFAFTSSGQADTPVIYGQVANAAARTSTGTGTGVQLGAVAAGQRVYAALHVVSATGTTPSLTVTIQGDTSNSFPSPTTVATFTAATAATSQIAKSTVGANADTWWRASWTISGTSPNFLFYVAIGIAP